MFISPAYAQAAPQTGVPGFDYGFLIMIGLMFAVMYVLVIRPQQKKAKEHKARIAAIRRGDRVITGGGIIGTVTKLFANDEVQIEIAEGVRVRVIKSTVANIQSKTAPVANRDDDEVEDGEDEAPSKPASAAKS